MQREASAAGGSHDTRQVTTVITADGASVWPRGHAEGDEGVPTLRDIATGLGRMPRFAGQLPEFYPVLSHTLAVADLVPDDAKVYALLHDAPEAVVGDVPTTWKTDAARAHEADLLERITLAIGLPWPWPRAAASVVATADAIMLAAEAHVLGHAAAERYWPIAAQPRAVFAAAVRRVRERRTDCARFLDREIAATVFEAEIGFALSLLDTTTTNEARHE